MKQGRTLGVIAVFVGGLLLNLTSVYAFHFIAGGGIYSLTSNGSEPSAQFKFLASKLYPPQVSYLFRLFRLPSSVKSYTKASPCRSGCSRPVRSSIPSQLRSSISIPRDREKSRSPGRCSLELFWEWDQIIGIFRKLLTRKLLALKPLAWMWKSLGQAEIPLP